MKLYAKLNVIHLVESQKAKLPTHVLLSNREYPLDKPSIILTEQIRTLDKQRLKWRVTSLHEATMEQVEHAMQISLGLIDINSLINYEKEVV